MKISLKKLEIHPHRSEETTAFDADVWIDGAKIGHATNNGRGGETRVGWIVSQERRLEIDQALKGRVPAGYRANGTTWAIDKIVAASAKRASSRGHARPITEVSLRDVHEAVSILGDQRTEEIVGPGGLSGATATVLRRLIQEAIDKRVRQVAAARKKSPAQLDREIAASIAGKSEARPRPASKSPAAPTALFSVMVHDPKFSIPGMTLPPMYSPAMTGLSRADAVMRAQRAHEETGGHVRVYVEGRNYDTADFGPRPAGYKPWSMTAKILPGVPRAR